MKHLDTVDSGAVLTDNPWKSNIWIDSYLLLHQNVKFCMTFAVNLYLKPCPFYFRVFMAFWINAEAIKTLISFEKKKSFFVFLVMQVKLRIWDSVEVPLNYSGEILYQYDLQSWLWLKSSSHAHITVCAFEAFTFCLLSIPHIHILDHRCQVCTVTHSNSREPQIWPFFICM